MHITGMKIGANAHPAFTEPFNLTFDKRANLLVGPNGCGKSSLLSLLAERAGAIAPVFLDAHSSPRIEVQFDGLWELLSENLLQLRGQRSNQFEHDALGIIPWAYIPASRVILPGLQDHADAVAKFDKARVVFTGNSIEIEWQDNSRIFDGRWVANLFDTLWSVRTRIPEYDSLLYTVKKSYLCAKDIASEVLSGSNYSDDVEYDPLGDLFLDQQIPPGMVAYTSINPYRWPEGRFIGDMSAGTQELYLWALHLALKMWWHYEFNIDKSLLDESTEWHEKPAILLIDEIENHLHPTWQRRVIPAFLEHFPGLQIFATTHSPFVVAGLKAGQVHVLKRDASGVVTASTNEQDVVGWTADEILRGMMGVDEPTDQLTVDRAKRLRELREKDELNDQEEEELNRLRRQVNEDLLNKRGPLEAQRERYADLMEEFLRSRQSELNQDGE